MLSKIKILIISILAVIMLASPVYAINMNLPAATNTTADTVSNSATNTVATRN